MGSFGPIHWLIVAAVVLLVFGGRGKISGLMGDAAKGIRAFRDGLKGDEDKPKSEAAKDEGSKPDAIKPGSKMPAMGLSDPELDAVTQYLETLR